MHLRLPLGTSDFAKVRRGGSHYVDKTGLVAELVRSSAEIVLLPRPRRFGKTLNLSMLQYWFERPVDPLGPGVLSPEDTRALFDGLEVAAAGEDIAASCQRHPTVALTFKSVKFRSWEKCQAEVLDLIRREVVRHQPTWSQAPIAALDRSVLDEIAAGNAENLHKALGVLTRALHLRTGEEVVLLIDEYDTPIHEGWQHGYYDQVIELFRGLLSAGIKDNKALYRGVLTGILRVGKESMFSGLNNVAVYSLLSTPFSQHFGFTEAEVTGLCALAGPPADLNGIQQWYNGYLMGGTLVYNPWSVLSYLAAPMDGLKPYWVNTASHDLLRDLLIRGGQRIQFELAELIAGREIERPISEDIQLRDLPGSGGIWSFLLFCGYLKARNVRQVGGKTFATLSVPNQEVFASYIGIFSDWMASALGGSEDVAHLCRALLTGDAATFGAGLQRLVLQSLSFFDTGARTAEAVYQAFVVGLLVQLNATHVVDTNRESGFGRYDVCVKPRVDYGGPRSGAVLELKSIDDSCEPPETSDTALTSAMTQIKDREYAVSLRQSGADPVWLWAVVFDGKRVRVRVERA